MPKTDKSKATRKAADEKTRRTAAEIHEAAAARLREKLAKAEERAKAAHAAATKKKKNHGKAAEAALLRAFALAAKAGVVLATNTDEREWAPLALVGRIARHEHEDGGAVLVLPTAGPVALAPAEDEDESWSDDDEDPRTADDREAAEATDES